jgi:WbqC-like protein family
MILSAHQPAYLPWLGYFHKIAQVDVFVYLDSVQFEKNSFINRNQIKTPQGASWLTIPVKTKGHMSGSLRTTSIDDSQPWRSKHLKSIEMNYRKAPRFDQCFPKIQALLTTAETNLAEYCLHQLLFWLAELGICNTRVVRSSDLPIASSKSDLVLDLCRHFGARRYLSGALGRDYLVEENFSKAAIAIEYQRFKSPVYPQLWGEFIPNLGVLDWWMNMSEPLTLKDTS